MKAKPQDPSKQEHVGCPRCGETLVRVNATGDPDKDFVEVASQNKHHCWETLPEHAEHLRIEE
jgi:hypothetical protein